MSRRAVPEWPPPSAPIEELLRFQSIACEAVGSPLYGDLLRRAAEDFEAGGPTAEILAGHEDDPPGSALALRLMGAVHRLVLAGEAPELAERYRSHGGDGDAGGERTWGAFREVLREHAGELAESVDRPVQTNEVGRCAALLPGFLSVAAEAGLPLRLLEVGASAGLNLRWDAYRYEAPGFAWGPPDSAVRIEFEKEGRWPAPPAAVEIAERRGCDAAPVDLGSEEGRRTMLAYVWPDQAHRMARMRAAIGLARELPSSVERARAGGWAAERLAEPSRGRATVLFHSIVMQYLPEDERAGFEGAVADAGERASPEAPLAWLRMEPQPGGGAAEVRITRWPGGEERLLAVAGYHGTPVSTNLRKSVLK